MESPSPRYLITRAIFLMAVLVALLYGFKFAKKAQRKSAIVAELKSISSDSSFFQQFYAEDAKKSLVRAVGLIAEANQLGLPPEQVIARSLNVEQKWFATDKDNEEPPPRQKIVTDSLRANYENFVKLGYKSDQVTFLILKEGTLPPIPEGPGSGKVPVIATLIDPAFSPGLEKVIANLDIRPPDAAGRAPTDVEIAAAKQLARDLAYAHVIEDTAGEKILTKLTELGKKN